MKIGKLKNKNEYLYPINVEFGNDASRSYYKFPDGLLIQSTKINTGIVLAESGSGKDIVWLIKFVDTSYSVLLTKIHGDPYWSFLDMTVATKITTGINVGWWNNHTQFSTSSDIEVVAIGRWK